MNLLKKAKNSKSISFIRLGSVIANKKKKYCAKSEENSMYKSLIIDQEIDVNEYKNRMEKRENSTQYDLIDLRVSPREREATKKVLKTISITINA